MLLDDDRAICRAETWRLHRDAAFARRFRCSRTPLHAAYVWVNSVRRSRFDSGRLNGRVVIARRSEGLRSGLTCQKALVVTLLEFMLRCRSPRTPETGSTGNRHQLLLGKRAAQAWQNVLARVPTGEPPQVLWRQAMRSDHPPRLLLAALAREQQGATWQPDPTPPPPMPPPPPLEPLTKARAESWRDPLPTPPQPEPPQPQPLPPTPSPEPITRTRTDAVWEPPPWRS
jgi:hypothetical protein